MVDQTALGLNHWWAKLAIEELLRLGVEHFCISPGSRCSPLALALAEEERCRTVVHFDERGAAFFALGLAKSTRRPSCLICTSGSALANYFPAVLEAEKAQVPLLLLSADRPVELRDSGANQTVDQIKFFGAHVRWSFTLPAPDQQPQLNLLLSVIDQGFFRSLEGPAGPVHINFEFREPLLKAEPERFELPQDLLTWSTTRHPYTRHSLSAKYPDQENLVALLQKIEKARSAVIVAAQLTDPAEQNAVARLARHLNWPVLADVTSGLRNCTESAAELTNCHYGFYLGSKQAAQYFAADLVLHFGAAPLSRVLSSFLGALDAEYVLINRSSARVDFGYRINQKITAAIPLLVPEIINNCSARTHSLLERFQRAERVSQAVIEEQRSQQTDINELFVAERIFSMTPPGSALFLGNSLPIRHAELISAVTDKDVMLGYQRGVSGIDGTVADACGFALGSQRKTTALIGDLACLHDLNSLALTRDIEQGLVLVVLNNDGGGIFNYLPVLPNLEPFRQYFETPHGFVFGPAAEMFGLAYYRPQDLAEFCSNYQTALSGERSCLIELVTNKQQNVHLHQSLQQEICLNLWG